MGLAGNWPCDGEQSCAPPNAGGLLRTAPLRVTAWRLRSLATTGYTPITKFGKGEIRLDETPNSLVSQGTRIVGKYDSVVAFGQRALVIWTRLVLPNGNSIVIENLAATDVAGYAGLEDQVDFHTWQLLKGVALATLIGVGTQLSIGNDESDLVKALRESTQQTTNRAGQRLVERELDVQPTITVRPGWPLRVIVSKDLVLKPYHDVQTAAKGR
ncbi:TrbI/VirB10 family protein [Bradyrhizobium erythrophlei]|uniref:TrbI/VirB10 family protein n=1 Tax=Bradyrhizobium erythrophlei TaxID=1437360 RepID=UPI0023EA65AC|nr:TrbI/VirB10 family protein [Bradyrhizobium erythrophlei]